MNNLVNLGEAFWVRCPFVRSQNSGVQVRSSTDEHVKVRSMFDKMAKIWELIKNLLPYLCDSAHVDC